MGFSTPLLIAALVATATAGPTGLRQECATTCSEASKFAFEKGMIYEYDYKINTNTKDFLSIPDANAELAATARATIDVVAPCEYVLTLSDVSLESSSHSSAFSSELTKSPLRFGFDDGRISDVCSQSEEAVWVTNFKRGILSMFQNTMANVHKDEIITDVDITGECETEYKVSSMPDGDTIIIDRSKSSDSCNHIAVGSHTTLPVPLQRLLLSSKETCVQQIKAGIIEEITCDQFIKFRESNSAGIDTLLAPIAAADGAITKVSTSLTFVSSTYGASVSDFEMSHTSLEFDGVTGEKASEQKIQAVEAILKELDENSISFVKSEVPMLFSQLVENLRHLDTNEMEFIYESNRLERVWRFLVDAAPMVATPASMAIVSDLVTLGQMTPAEADVWFTSMGFIPNPELEMFLALPNVLKTHDSDKALLGVSAMINSYCKKDSSCQEKEIIQNVLKEIEKTIGSGCRSYSYDHKQKVLVTLKALGNTGRWMNSDALETCFLDTSNPDEVRVAAIEAWRRAPCSYDRKRLMELYSEPTNDSELRIAAYLSMMACPTEELIDTIKYKLSSESVNHVGSFVWTHLSNLQESASQEKQWIRELIGEETLVNKFNTSALKFSRNYESSFFMQEQGFGTTLDSNVIFSRSSFLPRSGMFNLTVDVFGKPMNLLEIGGRMEGLEVFIEKFFGPNGYYPEETVEAIIRGMRQSQLSQETTLEHMLEAVTDEQEGSYYVRLFGNDVHYHHFRGIENFFDKSTSFNLVEMVMELARTGKVDYTRSFNLIDSEFNYPTVSGLPLQLKLNSKATVGLRMDGQFSATSFRDIDIAGQIYPSASIHSDVSMLIDAHFSKYGRKTTVDMETSTYFDGILKVNGGQLVDVSLNMPHDKTELLNVQQNKVFIEDDVDVTPYEPSFKTKEACTPTPELLGSKLCFTESISENLKYEGAILIEKTDSQTGYTLQYSRDSDAINFLMDTPGSTVDRKISLKASKTEESVTVDIHTPWKKMIATGNSKSSVNGHEYSMTVTADETRKYEMNADYSVLKQKSGTKIESTLKVATPSTIFLNTQGTFETNSEGKFMKIDIQETGQFMPSSLKFSSHCSDTDKKVEAQISSQPLKLSLSGSVDFGEKFASQFDAKYSLFGQSEESVSQYIKYNKSLSPGGFSYEYAFHQKISQLPQFNVDTKGKFAFVPGHLESSTSLSYGENALEVKSDNVITFDFSDSAKVYDVKMALVSPTHDVDFLLTQNFKLTSNTLIREGYMRLTPDYIISSKTEAGYHRGTEGYIRVKLSTPSHEQKHEFSFTKIADKYYTAQVHNDMNGLKSSIDLSYQDRSSYGSYIDIILGSKINALGVIINNNLTLEADPKKGITLDATADYQGKETYVRLDASQTNFKLESNVYNSLILVAKVTAEGPTRSVELDGQWNGTDIVTKLSFDSHSIVGDFQYGSIAKSFQAMIDDNGVRAEISLGANKVIEAVMEYEMGEEIVFTASLNTPFDGYEKQSAIFAFKRDGTKAIDGRINVTWKNSVLFSLAVLGNLEMSADASNMNIESIIVANPDVLGFERFNYQLKHSRLGAEIDSLMSGILDGDKIIDGKFETTNSLKEKRITAYFKTPITKDLTLKSEMQVKKSLTLEINYGEDFLKLTKKIALYSETTGFKYNMELLSSVSPDFRFETMLTIQESSKLLEMEATYGQLKGVAVFTQDVEQTADVRKVTNTGRIVLPRRTPITGSLIISQKIASKHSVIEFEVTRFWSSYGSLKIHSDFTVNSLKNAESVITVTSPDYKMTFETQHKLEEQNFEGFFKSSINGDKLAVIVNGIVKRLDNKIELNTKVLLQDELIMRVALNYAKQGETHVTKLKLKVKENTYNVHHELSFSNWFNWNNELSVNDFLFKNQMSKKIVTESVEVYIHDFDWNMMNRFFRGTITFNTEYTNDKYHQGIQVKCSSSEFTETEIEIDHFRQLESEKLSVSAAYGYHNAKVVSELLFGENWTLKTDVSASRIDDISLIIKKTGINKLEVELLENGRVSKATLFGTYSAEEKAAHIALTTPLLSYELIVDSILKQTNDKNSLSIAVSSDEVNEVHFSLSKSFNRKGRAEATMELPYFGIKETSFEIEFDCINNPIVGTASFKLQEVEHTMSIIIHPASLELDVNIAGIRGKVESSWNFSPVNGKIDMKASSPENDFLLEGKIAGDRANKKMEMMLKYNSVTIFSLMGKQEGRSAVLQGEILILMRTLCKANILVNDSHFTGILSQDEQKFEIVGNYNFNRMNGEYAFHIDAPFMESFTLSGDYNTMSENTFNLKASLGEKEISAKIAAIYDSISSPSLSVHITTFMDAYRKIGTSMTYDGRDSTKTVDVKVYQNEDQYTWKMQVFRESHGKGLVITEATSPFAGFENIKYGLDYDFSRFSYKFDLYREKNSVRDEFSFEALVNAEDRSVSGRMKTTMDLFKEISFVGKLNATASKIAPSVIITVNNVETTTIDVLMIKDFQNPSIEMKCVSPYEGFRSIEASSHAAISKNDIEVAMKLSRDDTIYNAQFSAKKSYKKATAEFTLNTPLEEYSSFSVKGEYNFLDDVKVASVDFEVNGVAKHLSVDLKLNDNKIVVSIATPVPNFENIILEGNFTSSDIEKMFMLNVSHGTYNYFLHGSVDTKLQQFTFRSTYPIHALGHFELTGQKTSTGYSVVLTQDGEVSEIKLDFNLDPSSFFVRLVTPLTGYRKVALEFNLDNRPGTWISTLKFEKEYFVVSLASKIRYSDLKSHINLIAKIPSFDQDIALTAKYDFTESMKTVLAVAKINDQEETFEITAEYKPTSASFKLTIPFINKDVAAEYKLNIDKRNLEMDALFKVVIDEETSEFNANGKITSSTIEVVATTPFEKLRKIQGFASVNRMEKTAEALLQFDQQKVSGKIIYNLSNALLDIETPFETLKHLKLVTSIVNEIDLKELGIEAVYNDQVGGFTAKYQHQLVLLELRGNDYIYKLEVSGEVNEKRGNISVAVQYPSLEILEDVHFSASIDLTTPDKAIQVILRRGDDIKEISLTGRFINDEAELKLKTPIAGFENFHTRGTLSRSKRSLEFSMMNDSALGAIRANFNSLGINIKTPYGAAREATLSMERKDGGGFTVHYKRGDNHFDMTVTPTGKRRSFDIALSSAVPGWEFLAITGRLDKEELIGYLSGQINEEKMSVEGGGKYSRQDSDLNFTITTPYEGYESVSAKLKSNIRRKEFSFEIKAGDAPDAFHIKIKTKPVLVVDIYVPNSAQPTIMKASFSLLEGKVSLSSRFPVARTFNLDYNVVVRPEFEIKSHVEQNGIELFKLEFKRGGGGAHLMIDARRGENHSMLHFHREGLESIEFIYNRNGREFKLEASSTGNPLQKGTIDIVVNNSFRQKPVTVTGKLDVDRTGSPKKVKLQLTYPGHKLYIIDLSYNFSLRTPKTGDYKLAITTPTKRAYPWQNISGSWDFTDKSNSKLTFKTKRSEFTAVGKFGLRESDFVLTPSSGPTINLTWHFFKTSTPGQRTRDYYFKVGTSDKFVMAKLKGTFSGLEHGEAEFAVQTPSMTAELDGKISWHRDASGLSGNGSFTYGSYSGTFTLNKLKRYAETRSAEISFVAHSNIPNFTTLTVEGNYSFNNEAVVKLDIAWDTDKISINFDVHDVFSEFTEQTASFTLPALGDISVTFGHDFRNKKKRTFTAIAEVGGRESFIKAEWNRNKDFTKLSGKADVKSIFLGDIHVTGQYDVRNIHNANGELHYNRNDLKTIDIKWNRVYSDRELNGELSFNSSFETLSVAKITVHGQFVDQFKLEGTLQINERRSTAELAVIPNSITFLVTTPREGFERIEGSLVYNFSDRKQRTATLRYSRGDVAVKMDFSLEMPSKKNGQLTMTVETPFDIVRTLDVNASWKNRKGEVHYKRNNIEYHFSGQADIKSDRTSFEGTFTPTSQEPVKIAFTFNTGSLVTGKGSAPEDVAKVELEMLGKRVAFDLKGFRNEERIMVEIKTESTFDALKKFDLKLDSELSTQERDGLLEITINDFHFRIRNHFERKPDSGYYFRTEIDTTMTALPGVILGFGREGDACILTVGVGEDREVTVTVIPKNEFKKGFSGKLSLPKRGILDAPYDVNYSFTGGNILNIDTHLELEPGKMIEADIVYNSDGVKARLSSPRTGRRSARARRSVTEDSYFFDAGVDDYSITLLAKNIMSNKGFIIEGEVFGTKVSIDSLLDIKGPNEGNGRFIISTNFEGYETLGGVFTFSNRAEEIHSRAEINLPSHITPKAFISIDLDLKEKVKGIISLDVSGQVFSIITDVTGSMKEGFTGKLNLSTPFHVASEVTISGNIKMSEDFKSLDSNINVIYPLGRKDIVAKYSLNPLNVEVKLNNCLHFELMSHDTEHKLSIDVLRAKFSGELQRGDDSKQAKFFLDLRTIGFMTSPIIIEATQGKSSSAKVLVEFALTVFEETHALSYTDKSQGNSDVTVVLQSSLVGGRQMISIKIEKPRSSYYSDSFAAQISYVGINTYDLAINVDRSENLEGSVVFTCPSGTCKYDVEVDLGENENVSNTKMHLKLLHSEHDLSIRIEKDIDYMEPAGKISGNVILFSSLLKNEISYSVKVEYDNNTKITEQVMKIGDVEHVLKAGYAYNSKGAKIEISFDTPLFELGKNSITAELKSNEIKRVIVKIVHHDNLHSLDIKVNMDEKNMSAVSKSSYWPGGMIKAEVSAEGESTKDLTILTSFKYAKKNLGAKLSIEAESLDNIISTLEVKTPYPGYKKLNLGASFIHDEFVTISFFAHKPLGYSFELKTGKDDEVYKTEIDIKTPHEGLETISAGALIPTEKIAPKMFLTLPESEYGLDFSVENNKVSSKVGGNVNMNGKLFGAGFGLRNTPPYEFSYFARNQDVLKQSFHIMMDSSFYSLFSLFA